MLNDHSRGVFTRSLTELVWIVQDAVYGGEVVGVDDSSLRMQSPQRLELRFQEAVVVGGEFVQPDQATGAGVVIVDVLSLELGE